MVAEFAVVAGLLLVLLLALADLGAVLHEQLVLTQAVREGARRAAVAGGERPEVVAVMRGILAAAGLDADGTWMEIRPRQAIYGTTIWVRARYEHRLTSPLLRSVMGAPVLVLRAEAVTRSELLDEP